MKNTTCANMEERKLNKLEEWASKHITVVDELPFRIADDDPFLAKKMEEAYKTLEKAPLPDFLLRRMEGKD